jgi:tripartite-type tricarboxylate transporter receptor subunit TctC
MGLAGVALLATSPFVLVAAPQFPGKSLQEVIAILKSKPGEIIIGSSGFGTTNHIAIAEFSKAYDVRPTHVPFRGGADTLNNVLSGQASLAFQSLAFGLPQIIAGSINAIAVTGTTRHPQLPSVPTFAEALGRGISTMEWVGVFAPIRTTDDIRSASSAVISKAAAHPDFRRQLANLAYAPAALVGSDFDRFLATEFRPDGMEGVDCCPKKACPDMKICSKK